MEINNKREKLLERMEEIKAVEKYEFAFLWFIIIAAAAWSLSAGHWGTLVWQIFSLILLYGYRRKQKSTLKYMLLLEGHAWGIHLGAEGKIDEAKDQLNKMAAELAKDD